MDHPGYRADIDGLRAVAVLAVVLYHAFPALLPGGYVGVDVFFVISGYLITGIILGNLDRGTFSFKEFYARRVKRIFPALIVVLVVVLVLGGVFLLPMGFADLGSSAAAGAGSVANVWFWQQAGYFDGSAESKPLLHLWSLGVEEQFYLLWPLLLVIGWRRRFAWWMTACLIALSFSASVYLVHVAPSSAFYLPIPRFWELLAGGSVAKFVHLKTANEIEFERTGQLAAPVHISNPSVRNIAALGGLLMIVVPMFFFDTRTPFPGVAAVPSVLGASIVIAVGPKSAPNRWVLSSRFMVWIGLLSYPLYLWHWPLLCFARLLGGVASNPLFTIAMVVLSVVLAWSTLVLVERPIRRTSTSRRLIPALSASMSVLFLTGLVVWGAKGFPGRLGEDARLYATYSYDYRSDARIGTCWLSEFQGIEEFSPSCVSPSATPGAPMLLVWGDSHAGRLFPGMLQRLSQKYRLIEFARDSCPALLEGMYARCNESNAEILARIAVIHPDIVVLFGYWNHQIELTSESVVLQRLDGTIAALRARGVKRIVVMGPAPQWARPLPEVLLHMQRSVTMVRPPARTTFGLAPGSDEVEARFGAHFDGRKDVEYFSVRKQFCNKKGCLTRIGDDPRALTTWDYGHLTTPAAAFVATHLGDALNGHPKQ